MKITMLKRTYKILKNNFENNLYRNSTFSQKAFLKNIQTL